MPKKKNFRKKNSKREEILIGPEENMESSAKEMRNSTTQSHDEEADGADDSKKERDHDNNENFQAKEGKQESSAAHKNERKRFSFVTKKNKHAGQDQNNIKPKFDKKRTKGSGVQRSSSLSLSNDSKETTSKIPRYHTLQPRGKYLSASCSNFNTTQALSLSKDGRDNWRMSGLLETVEKSNSMYSLNSSVNEDSLNFDKDPITGDETDIKLHHVTQTTTGSHTGNVKQGNIVETTNKELQETSVDGIDTRRNNISCSIELVDEVIVEESGDDIIEDDNEQEIVNKDKSETGVVDNTSTPPASEFKVDLKGHTSSSPSKVSECKKNVTDIANGEINLPTEKERYDLDDENFVTIESLDDVVHDRHIELPNDIQSDDWLVLNLMHQSRPIPTC